MVLKGLRVLVTGGSSFIGSHVVARLLEDEVAEVRVVDLRGPNEHLRRFGSDTRLSTRVADVRSEADVRESLTGVDAVFHGAGLVTRQVAQSPAAGVETNVLGTASLLRAAVAEGVRRIVLMSSVSVYGSATGVALDEDTPFVTSNLGWPSLLYGGSKLLAEGLCRAIGEAQGLEWIGLRAPSVYGPYQHEYGLAAAKLVEMWSALVGLAPRPVVRVSAVEAHDYIFVSDVAQAAAAALASQESGFAVNVASGESTDFTTVLQILREITGSTTEVVLEPSQADVRLNSAERLSYDRRRAEDLLGWRPEVTLREGLHRLAEWLETTRGREAGREVAEAARGSDKQRRIP